MPTVAKCKYPDCDLVAKASWALVPICFAHHELIETETFQHYNKRLGNAEREHYLKIKHLTPFKSIRHAREDNKTDGE